MDGIPIVAMVLLKSTDLVNWNHSVINMQKRYVRTGKTETGMGSSDYLRCGSRKILWFIGQMKYGDGADVIYYAYANKEFTDLEGEPKPFSSLKTRNLA